MKLIITGGHHTSALPVIEELKRIDPTLEFIWIGHKYSMQKDSNVSAEYKEITSLNIPFYDIHAGKFYRIYNPLRLFKVLGGFFNAFKLLLHLKPDGILSFGGYIAVPVVLSGFVLGIPSVTHEQTVVIGIANKLISLFVKKILVSWERTIKYLPNKKTLVTGLPVRKDLFVPRTNNFEFRNSLPVIYITGGKQGAHIINENVKAILKDLLQIANVIHQCGSFSVYNDLEVLDLYRKSLPEELKERYRLSDYIFSQEVGEVLNKADLVVSRAGANTVYELLVLKKPSILIPIPWVSHNEQFENAKVLEEANLGIIIHQKDLTPELLLSKVTYMLNNMDRFKLKEDNKSVSTLDSAKVIAHETYKTLFKR